MGNIRESQIGFRAAGTSSFRPAVAHIYAKENCNQRCCVMLKGVAYMKWAELGAILDRLGKSIRLARGGDVPIAGQ